MIDRSGCPAKKHGDESAHRQGCICSDARRDRLVRRKARECGIHTPALVEATGTSRRLRALAVMGWTSEVIGQLIDQPPQQLNHYRWGRRPRLRRDRADRIAAVYEQLSIRIGPSTLVRTRALQAGWPGPMAWEGVDIDDPAAQPVVDPPESARRRESSTREELAHLLAMGESLEQVAKQLDIHIKTAQEYAKKAFPQTYGPRQGRVA